MGALFVQIGSRPAAHVRSSAAHVDLPDATSAGSATATICKNPATSVFITCGGSILFGMSMVLIR